MSLADLLFFVASSVGMTLIVVYGNIFEPVRKFISSRAETSRACRTLSSLLSCVQCSGFWCGVFCGLYFTGDVFGLFLRGCAASVAAMAVDKGLMYLHAMTTRP